MSTKKAAGGGDDEDNDNDNIDLVIVHGMDSVAADEVVKKPSAGMTQEFDATTGSPLKSRQKSSNEKSSVERVLQTHTGANLSSITNRSFLSAVRTILMKEPGTSQLVGLIQTKITGNKDKINSKALRKAFAAGVDETGQMRLGWPIGIIGKMKAFGGPDPLTGVSPICLSDDDKSIIQTFGEIDSRFTSAQIEHSESGVGFWPKTGYKILQGGGYKWHDNLTDKLEAFYNEINSHNIGVGRSYATPSAKTKNIINTFEMLYNDNQQLFRQSQSSQSETDFPPLEILIIMIEFYLSWSQPNQVKSDATFMHDARQPTTRNHANHVHVFVKLLNMTMRNESRPDKSLDINSLRTSDDITNGKPLHAGTFFAFMDASQIKKEAPIIKRCWKTQGLYTPQAIMQSLETNITWRYEMMDSLRGALLYQTAPFNARRSNHWKKLFLDAHTELYHPGQSDLQDVLYERNTLTQDKLEENWRVLKSILVRRQNKQGGPKTTQQDLLVAELAQKMMSMEEAEAKKAKKAKKAEAEAEVKKAEAKKAEEDARANKEDRDKRHIKRNQQRLTEEQIKRNQQRLIEEQKLMMEDDQRGGTRRKRRLPRPKRTRRVCKSSKARRARKSTRKAKTRRRVKK